MYLYRYILCVYIYINYVSTYIYIYFFTSPFIIPHGVFSYKMYSDYKPFLSKKNDPGIGLKIPLNFSMLVSWELLNPPRGNIMSSKISAKKPPPFSHLHFFGDLCQGVFQTLRSLDHLPKKTRTKIGSTKKNSQRKMEASNFLGSSKKKLQNAAYVVQTGLGR